MKMTRKSLLAGAFVAVGATAAHAHAQLQSTGPRVGSTVRAAPPVLTLNFSEAVEAALSAVLVTDAAGRRVDAGRVRVNKANSQQVQVPLRAVGVGTGAGIEDLKMIADPLALRSAITAPTM